MEFANFEEQLIWVFLCSFSFHLFLNHCVIERPMVVSIYNLRSIGSYIEGDICLVSRLHSSLLNSRRI